MFVTTFSFAQVKFINAISGDPAGIESQSLQAKVQDRIAEAKSRRLL